MINRGQDCKMLSSHFCYWTNLHGTDNVMCIECNWPHDSGEEIEYVKILQIIRLIVQELIRKVHYSSGELKNNIYNF